ncbi:Increased DNA methylation 1 [Bienertia sinuspersici]
MREGLRSSSSKREDEKSGLGHSDGDLERVKIPDLNLENDQVEVSSEERGKLCCELSRTDEETNGLVSDKEGLGDDDDKNKGIEVENRGLENGSLDLECSRNDGGEGNEVEEGVEGKVNDVNGSKEGCLTREINGEEVVNASSGVMRRDSNVVGERKQAVMEGLDSTNDSDDRVLDSSAAVDKDKGVEDNGGSVLSQSVEEDVKKKDSESISRCINVNSDLKTDMEEEHVEVDPDMSVDVQSNPGAVMESPEKPGVNAGTKRKLDEDDKSEQHKTEDRQEKVQAVARILRSRVVPGSGLGEETPRGNNRVFSRIRNRLIDGQGEEAAVMKDENIKSDVDTENTSDSGRSKRFVEPNSALVIAGVEAEDVSSKLIRSSKRKGKRGRPKISRDSAEEEVAQMIDSKAVSNVEDKGLNNNSAVNSKKKDGRGRPRKYAKCFDNEEVVADKTENELGDASNKSVGKPTISRDQPEQEVAQMDEVKASKVKDKGLKNTSVRRSKKKKRGRPKKSANSFENEKGVYDIIEDGPVDASNKSVGEDEEGLNNKSAKGLKKKDGRGRPRKHANCSENEPGDVSNKSVGRSKGSRDHSEKVIAQMNEVSAAKVDDEGLNNKSAKSPEKKDGRGRRRKSANCSKNEKVVAGKIESSPGNVSNKSVGSITPTRKSGRHKRSVDYSEEGTTKRRRKFFFTKQDDETLKEDEDTLNEDEDTLNEDEDTLNEDEDKGVIDKKVVKKSNKKGKRGRPKKELGNGEPKMKCHNKDKVKGGRKMKVSLATAPVRRSRHEIHPHSKPVSPSDGVSPQKGIRSNKKVNFAGLEKDTVEGSKGEETPLHENMLPVKRKRVEAAGSLSSEKNLIRKQIVEMLLKAGWTVQLRPRNGREYNDAVYVNREGKTHWSVTKAYNSLLQEVEEGKAGSEFTFTPLPEELLSKLFRVVSKTRSDKNKKKKNKGDGDSSDEEGTGDKKRKAGARKKDSNLKRKRVGTQGRRRCPLLVRGSNKGSTSDNDGAIAHRGKHSVLAWMIDMGTISLNGKVHYKNCCEAELTFEGSITRDGIHCSCCKEIISVSEFEIHAGSNLCQLYENVYLESGSSLLQCLLDSWNKQNKSIPLGFHGVNVDEDDPNDDTCAICGDGGDLMCCDGCPSTFHQGCLNLEEVPSDEWLCVYCSCKVCGMGGESATVTQEVECETVSPKLVNCSLCEEKCNQSIVLFFSLLYLLVMKYEQLWLTKLCLLTVDHKSCASEENELCAESKGPDFCGKNCEQIYERLGSLLGAKCDLGNGFSYTLLQRYDLEAESATPKAQKIQDNSKLAVALAVMEECFVPIIDPRSGVNMIRHVVYSCGSNFNRLNYSKFLTVVLEKGDEVISAASIRIRGKQLAEMPFIGTRNVYRRQGMCRRLLAGIELVLGTLEIEKLVIPAIPDLLDTWTSVFGFKPLEEPVIEEMRSMNLLVFAHTDMLQKPIAQKQSGVKSPTLIAEKDSNSGVSENDNTDGGTEKTNADKLEIDNSNLNGKFDLNCVAPTVPDSSEERHLVHPDSDAENCEDEVKSRMNSGDLNDAKNEGPCTNSSEVRTLHPDLNLMAENDSLSDEKSHGHHSDTMKSDDVAKSTSNSSGLTNVKGCCVVESDNDQNGDSTAVTSSEERRPNPNSERNFVDQLSKLDGQTPADPETRRDCQPEEIRCSDIETSKAHDVGPNDGTNSAGTEVPPKSIDCSESEALVVCTRTTQLASESSCNMSSVAGESCIAGVFHGSGIAKVGPTKS